jgi:thymidylate synthase
MRAYLNLLRDVLEHGERRTDRTGTGTISMFGAQTRYDLRDGFPLVTTKKVLFGAVVRELLWFLRGSTNIRDDLTQHTPIWDAWADESGELGPIYGYQWRNWGGQGPLGSGSAGGGEADLDGPVVTRGPQAQRRGSEPGRGPEAERGEPASTRGIDQIQLAIDAIKNDPMSRRIIVSAWNVSDLPKMRLPPCHAFFQFYVHDKWLDCQLYQRSADLALGVPFNIASYALLMSMIAQECGLAPRYFIHTLGDAHIYLNHVEGVKIQLSREPLSPPKLVLANKPTLEMTFEDIQLVDYQHHPFIKFPVAV